MEKLKGVRRILSMLLQGASIVSIYFGLELPDTGQLDQAVLDPLFGGVALIAQSVSAALQWWSARKPKDSVVATS